MTYPRYVLDNKSHSRFSRIQ